MNSIDSEKYGISPEEVEKMSLSDEKFKAVFNLHRIEKTRQVHERLNRYDKKKYKLNQHLENFISSQYKISRILAETKYFESEKNRKLIKLINTGSKI